MKAKLYLVNQHRRLLLQHITMHERWKIYSQSPESPSTHKCARSNATHANVTVTAPMNR